MKFQATKTLIRIQHCKWRQAVVCCLRISALYIIYRFPSVLSVCLINNAHTHTHFLSVFIFNLCYLFGWPQIQTQVWRPHTPLSRTLYVDHVLILNLNLILEDATKEKYIYSKAQALRFTRYQISWVSDWLSDWVRDFSPWARSAIEVAKETKFGKKVA